VTIAEQVEAAARRLGVWVDLAEGLAGEWTFAPADDGIDIVGPAVPTSDGAWEMQGPRESWSTRVSCDLAALLLACYADGGRVRMPCPDCAERGGPMEWAQTRRYSLYYSDERWAQRDAVAGIRRKGWRAEAITIKEKAGRSGAIGRVVMVRPCQTCTRTAEIECPGCEGSGGRHCTNLHDRPIGTPLKYAPGPPRQKGHVAFDCTDCAGSGRVPETVECQECDGSGEVPDGEILYGDPLTGAHEYVQEWARCLGCEGDGRVHAPGKPAGYVEPTLVEAVLRARPQRCPAGCRPRTMESCPKCNHLSRPWKPGDPTTRDHLAVEADKRQNEAVPCSACAGSLVVDGESCRECARVCYCCGNRDPSGYCAPCSRDHERDIKCIDEPDGVDFAATRRRQLLGEALALWLRGAACPACKGRRKRAAQADLTGVTDEDCPRLPRPWERHCWGGARAARD
jgi:hypothetical protein